MKPIRTFLLTAGVSIAAVTGLAPAGHAAPLPPGGFAPPPVIPTPTIPLPPGPIVIPIDPCLLFPSGCGPLVPIDPLPIDPCVVNPAGCRTPPTVPPGGSRPQTPDTTPTNPGTPGGSSVSTNPDVPVKGRAAFTG